MANSNQAFPWPTTKTESPMPWSLLKPGLVRLQQLRLTAVRFLYPHRCPQSDSVKLMMMMNFGWPQHQQPLSCKNRHGKRSWHSLMHGFRNLMMRKKIVLIREETKQTNQLAIPSEDTSHLCMVARIWWWQWGRSCAIFCDFATSRATMPRRTSPLRAPCWRIVALRHFAHHVDSSHFATSRSMLTHRRLLSRRWLCRCHVLSFCHGSGAANLIVCYYWWSSITRLGPVCV